MTRKLMWVYVLTPLALVVSTVLYFTVPRPYTQVVYLDAHYTPGGNIQTLTHELSAWVEPDPLVDLSFFSFGHRQISVRASKDRLVIRERPSRTASGGRVLLDLATRYEGTTYEAGYDMFAQHIEGALWWNRAGQLHWLLTDPGSGWDPTLFSSSADPSWHKSRPGEPHRPGRYNPAALRDSHELIVERTALYELDHRTRAVRRVEGVLPYPSIVSPAMEAEFVREGSRKHLIEEEQREIAHD